MRNNTELTPEQEDALELSRAFIACMKRIISKTSPDLVAAMEAEEAVWRENEK